MSAGAVSFTVRLTPRSGRDAIDGVTADGWLGIRVSAPPADGAANQSLLRILASDLGVPISSVSIATGLTGRRKRIVIEGLGPADVSATWPGLAVGTPTNPRGNRR